MAHVKDAGAAHPNVKANRSARKWTGRELIARATWEVLRTPLFRCTPRPMWAWRRWILRMFGAHIGRNVHVYPSVRIAIPWNLTIAEDCAVGDGAILYALGSIRLGRGVTISQFAHLCAGTHDYRLADLPVVKSEIVIEPGVWVCADAFIGPDVTVGELSIVAARAVVVKDVPPRCIVAGNPARRMADRPFPLERPPIEDDMRPCD